MSKLKELLIRYHSIILKIESGDNIEHYENLRKKIHNQMIGIWIMENAELSLSDFDETIYQICGGIGEYGDCPLQDWLSLPEKMQDEVRWGISLDIIRDNVIIDFHKGEMITEYLDSNNTVEVIEMARKKGMIPDEAIDVNAKIVSSCTHNWHHNDPIFQATWKFTWETRNIK